MKKIFLLSAVFLFTGCIIRKEVKLTVHDSQRANIRVYLSGSDLDDVKPELSLPLIP